MKKRLLIGIIIMTMILPYVNAGIIDFFKDIFESPGQTEQTDVSVTVGNSPPAITNVQAISNIALIPGTTTNVVFNFSASDANGISTLVDTTTTARFTKTGEPERGSGNNCINVGDVGNQRTYQCTVTMQFYDAPGTWSVNVSVKDNSAPAGYGENITTTAIVSIGYDILLSITSFSFPSVSPGTSPNAVSTQNTTITNKGNSEDPLNANLTLRAFNLSGTTNSNEYIPATSFRAVGRAQAVNVCAAGTVLDDEVDVNILSAVLSRGASSTEEFVYCLATVPSISSQTYSTTGAGSQRWLISIG